MAQGALPFKYEVEERKSGMTSLAGLPAYLELAHVAGLRKSIERHIGVRGSQGWTDAQVVTALMLLNLAGGDSVEDVQVLESDEGFCKVVRQVEHYGLSRRERRELERRWRKKRERSLPSVSAVFRYLSAFHDPDQEQLRVAGKAFIPVPNDHLRGFARVNAEFISFLQSKKRAATATLDMDATLIETTKSTALYGYKGYSCYQPLNVWWSEQEMVLYSEFRDGNVPAGYEQLRVLQEALRLLPDGVDTVRLRSDTAGYQHDLLKYCEQGDTGWGRIEFAIGCSVTPEFKRAVAETAEADWHDMYVERNGKRVKTGTQWAEVCFVPNQIGHSKKGPAYRYLAKRRLLNAQRQIPGVEQSDADLPFPTMIINQSRYKVFGVVTNMDWDAEELLHWHHKRCGKSEEAHAVMKEDLAGGKLPSSDFGVNAAWWWVMILSLNLNNQLKALALGKEWKAKRLKAIRFWLINLPGNVLQRSRSLFIRISGRHPGFELLMKIRQKISALQPQET
jgi:hypothetical protein